MLLTVGCLVLSAAGSLAAQNDEQAVRAAVQQLFDGMRSRDTAKMRAVLHPEARLVSTGIRDGAPVVRLVPMARFLESVAGSTGGVLDERLWNTTVQVEAGLATVWTGYTLFVGDRMSHCGIDAFHLVKTPSGWQIIDLADTRRTEGCPPS